MEPARLIACLVADSEALVAACEAAPPDVRVPACPEWTPADLLWHTAEVHHFWSSIVSGLLQSPESYVRRQRAADAGLPDLYRRDAAHTATVLRDADPAATVWTWAGPRDVAWVTRRMAHETAVHRWDAQGAGGAPGPLNAELASDGIDEFLHVFLPWGADEHTLSGSAHLHCTDAAGEWTIRPVDGAAPSVSREHAKGDCALRGAASDLLLALWHRVGIDALDVIGDASVAASFLAYTPTR